MAPALAVAARLQARFLDGRPRLQPRLQPLLWQAPSSGVDPGWAEAWQFVGAAAHGALHLESPCGLLSAREREAEQGSTAALHRGFDASAMCKTECTCGRK